MVLRLPRTSPANGRMHKFSFMSLLRSDVHRPRPAAVHWVHSSSPGANGPLPHHSFGQAQESDSSAGTVVQPWDKPGEQPWGRSGGEAGKHCQSNLLMPNRKPNRNPNRNRVLIQVLGEPDTIRITTKRANLGGLQ